jgi:hypothetical protein
MKFNYEFSDLKKAKRVAANLSLPSDMENISRKNYLEGILLLLANCQNESFGDWNGDERCTREGECEADDDGYKVSIAINCFLYDMGLFDSEMKTWKDFEEIDETWKFDDKIELFEKYFNVGDYASLKNGLSIYHPLDGSTDRKLLTEESIRRINQLEAERFEKMSEREQFYDMFPDGYIGDGVYVSDIEYLLDENDEEC